MTQHERELEVRRRLYRYASYVREVERYAEDILHATPQHDESGVRSPGISDPTARIGIALLAMPPDIELKRQWVYAIEDAMDEIRESEEGDFLILLSNKVYGMDGKRHKKRKYRDTSYKIACEMNLSVSSLYTKLGQVNRTVMYHAVKRGLI